jgi:RNA polymerase sigma factor (sigma-70 family)
MPDSPPTRIETLLEHRAWVRRVARALVTDPASADDLEQAAWLKAQQRPPRHGGALRAWLGTVLRRTASDARRTDRRRAAREEAAARPERTPSTADLVGEAEALKRVVSAVVELEEPFRTTLLLRYVDDLSPPEIAGRQDVPLEAVRTRLKRGLARLRERFDAESGGDRRAWSLALLPPAQRADPGSEASLGGVSSVAVVAGALVMGTQSKVLVAAAAIVFTAIGVGAWIAAGNEEPSTRAVAQAPKPLPPSAPPYAPPGPRGLGLETSTARAEDAAAAPAAPADALASRPEVAGLVVEVVDERGERVREGSLSLAPTGDFATDLITKMMADVVANGNRFARIHERFDLAKQNPVVVSDLSGDLLGCALRATATVPGYPPAESTDASIEAGKVARLTIALAPARRVVFDVRDAATGAPIAGARVLSLTELSTRRVQAESIETADGEGWSTTEINGQCTVDGLGAGDHEVEVLADGYCAGSLEVATSAPQPVTVRLETSHDDSMLEVLVTDPDSAPVDGIDIHVNTRGRRTPLVVATDAAGIARFRGLPAGLQFVQMRSTTWALRSRDGGWGGRPAVLAASVELARGETRRVALGHPRATASLSCVVVDERGQPSPGIAVRLFGPSARDGVTDAEGRVEFRDLLAGAYRTILRRGDGPAWFEEREHALLEGASAVARRVLGHRSFKGSVRAVDDERFIAGLRVFVEGPFFASAPTRGDRTFQVGDVVPGRYRVKASADGFADGHADVDVPENGREPVVDLRLHRGGRVLLHVAEADRARLEASRLRLVRADGSEVTLRRDSTGAHHLLTERLAPGRYVLELARGEGERTARVIEISDGADSVVDLSVP